MGICSEICSPNIKGKKEVNIDQLKDFSSGYIKTSYMTNHKYPLVIYLQLKIKNYLKHKKRKAANVKINLNTSNISSNRNDYTLKKNNMNNNKKEQSTIERLETSLNNNSVNYININDKNEINDPYYIISQNIRDNSKQQDLYAQDPFKSKDSCSYTTNQINNTNTSLNKKKKSKSDLTAQITDDPREQPHNNIRQNYPKLEEDGFTYIGEWKNGKRDGLGVLSMKDISKYIGEFKDNIVFGFGILLHGDGGKCVSYWDDFKANGIGYYIGGNGFFSKGYWENDRLEGYGIENWINGQYEGDYSEGNKQGIGELFFNEAGIYKGEFDESRINGYGTFIFKDGRKYEGMWKHNKMNGYGIITLSGNKSWFEGEFIDDKREGFGVFYTGRKIYIGFWKNSKLEGEIIIVENGNIKKQYWEGGKTIRNLPNERKIYFEKYINEIIQRHKIVNNNSFTNNSSNGNNNSSSIINSKK